jgi:hypothetical protein
MKPIIRLSAPFTIFNAYKWVWNEKLLNGALFCNGRRTFSFKYGCVDDHANHSNMNSWSGALWINKRDSLVFLTEKLYPSASWCFVGCSVRAEVHNHVITSAIQHLPSTQNTVPNRNHSQIWMGIMFNSSSQAKSLWAMQQICENEKPLGWQLDSSWRFRSCFQSKIGS